MVERGYRKERLEKTVCWNWVFEHEDVSSRKELADDQMLTS
jgi:hypothetical protein